MRIAVIILLTGLTATNSFAQVIKCTDPKTKQVTYTDNTCPASTEVKQIESRQSDVYKMNEAIRAGEAKERIAQGFQREAEVTANHDVAPQTYYGGSSNNSGSFECGIAKQALGVEQSHLRQNNSVIASKREDAEVACLGSDTHVQLENARAAKKMNAHVVAAPSVITSCDAAGCWGSNGIRYNATGPNMFNSNGKTCQQVGNMMQCN